MSRCKLELILWVGLACLPWIAAGESCFGQVRGHCLWLDEVRTDDGVLATGDPSYRVYQLFPVFEQEGTGQFNDANTILSVITGPGGFGLVQGQFFQTAGIPGVPNRDVTGYDPADYEGNDIQFDTFVSVGLRDNPNDVDATISSAQFQITPTEVSGSWRLPRPSLQGAATNSGVGGNAGLPDVFLGQFGVVGADSLWPMLNTGALALAGPGRVAQMRTDLFYGSLVLLTAEGNDHTLEFTPGVVLVEDYNGHSLGLLPGSFDPIANNIDGGPGVFFGVGPVGDANLPDGPQWPQTSGVPFAAADDSVIDVSGGTRDPANSLPGDNIGIFGQARDPGDGFFLVSDTVPNITPDAASPATAQWVFDIAELEDLEISIDMGAMGDFEESDFATFTAIIDDEPSSEQIVFDVRAALGESFEYRAFDDGDVFTLPDPLQVLGEQPIRKNLVDAGRVAEETFLDRSPAQGPGAGRLDMFTTNIAGAGSTLTLTLTTALDGGDEAFAFDSIRIIGSPLPVLDLPGDFNGDGNVDAADYTVWRDSAGQTGSDLAADANGDGEVNGVDYDIWRENFGRTTQLLDAASGVPEPSALAVVLIVVGAGAWLRRRAKADGQSQRYRISNESTRLNNNTLRAVQPTVRTQL